MSSADWTPLQGRISVKTYRHHFSSQEDLIKALDHAEIIVAMRERTSFSRSVLENLPRLRLLVTTGMRNAAIDLEVARERGIVVLGTEGKSPATTELTFALILGLARSLVPETLSLRARGPWQKTLGTELYGKTLGILGLGHIGTQVARIASAFGMKVLAWSQNLTVERATMAGAELAISLHDLLSRSDFVSIHLVLSDRTRGLLGPEELAQMKPSSYLINTSRGAIVDELALKEVLIRGRIAGAGLDVFTTEPLPMDHSFRSLKNVLATPHLGYVSQETYQNWYRQVVEDIESYLAGRPIRSLL